MNIPHDNPSARRAWHPWLGWTLAALFLLLAAMATTVQLAPTLIGQGRDSGVYAYGGMVLHAGGAMYVDVWDNKLPGIHFINALAFALFGVDRWALWWIEVIFVALAALALAWLLHEAFGRPWLTWPLALAFLVLAHNETLVFDVDFTEPFALLPQAVGFACGYQLVRRPRARWGFLLGLSAAAALIIKQSTIGYALAFVPAVLLAGPPVRAAAHRLRLLGVTIMGVLSGLGILALYLARHGVLRTGIEAGFVAPAAFHRWVGEVPVVESVRLTLVESVVPEVFGPLGPVLILGALAAGCWSLRRPYNTPAEAARATLALWALLTFPVDLVLVNPTGRGASFGYAHYYVTLIPAVMLLLASGLVWLSQAASLHRAARAVLIAASLGWIMLTVAAHPVEVALERLDEAGWDLRGPEIDRPMTRYIEANTWPDDRVLVWGASPNLNFQSRRFSPTKYFYAYGLLVPDDDTQRRIVDMIRELDESPPAMIMDMTMYDGNRVPPLDAGLRREWWARGGRRDTADLSPLYEWVAEHCTVTDRVDWVMIYACAPT